MKLPVAWNFLLAALCFAVTIAYDVRTGHAHEVRPALLEIKETEPGLYDVTWKIPIFQGRLPYLHPRFAENISVASQPTVRDIPGARVEKTTYAATSGSLLGTEIFIDGLSALQTDVLVQVTLTNDVYYSTVIRPKDPRWTVPETQSNLDVFVSYAYLGGEHILEGLDHLLFVFALMLLIRDRWMLLKAVTAFTLGHSVTLALATLGVLNIPSPPTETVIALSIVFLASEIIHHRNGIETLATRSPWLIAAGFGLIHGLGFAGALTDIGLPQHALPLALFAFNVGVEIGQVLFIIVVLTAIMSLRKIGISEQSKATLFGAYAIGIVAAYWTVDRIASVI